MYAVYSILIVAFFAVVSPYLLYQAVRYRKYIGSLPQRMGYLPLSFNLDGDESIWIHAVSVGEVLTARALLPQLRERYPWLRLFVSTTTMTGQQVARTNLPFVDEVFYFPFDLGFIVARTLRLVKPRLFIMMETEIWPNLLRACRAKRREDGARERPHLVAVVSSIPARQALLPPRASARRPILHAERGVCPPHH
jgi:3-deoxy-D-manno-octulosonic-acid transferase